MLEDAFVVGDVGETPDAPTAEDAPMGVDAPTAGPTTVGGDRPTRVFTPTGYDPAVPAPLVILLHGYGADGATQDLYFQVTRNASVRGMFALRPDGIVDGSGSRFWNAAWCCDFADVGVDDVAYLVGLVDEMKEHYNIDPNRVYAMGHSNGHFMSYRLACDAADTFTAIAGLAGSTFLDDADCTPTRPVSTLHLHGTADTTIPYTGYPGRYPSAMDTVERFATRAGCTGTEMGDDIDVEGSIVGNETEVLRHTGCDAGLSAELWSIQGGSHIPNLDRETIPNVLDWLLTHSM